MDNMLKEVNTKTGIPTEKLKKEIKVMNCLGDVFGFAEKKIVLFGGTALNKIFFHEKQRLSYDVDLKCGNFSECLAIFGEKYERVIDSKIFTAFSNKDGVRIDLSKEDFRFKKIKMNAKSFFYYQGFETIAVNVITYEFEVLFAEKILAMSRRGTARDLYDTWIGRWSRLDEKKLLKYLIKLGNKKKVDSRFIITKFHQQDFDMSKLDHPLGKLDGKKMYQEVQDFIKYLFFDKK